jgi:uncharacterized protein (DUF305 family)
MKRTLFATAVMSLAMLAGGSPTFAQDGVDLPAICTADDPHAGMAMGGDDMGMAMAADDAHADLMDSMAVMNRDMMAGGTATDIDVAFVCSMIPHHRGAIDMAKAELAHGDDPWVRKVAESVIAAQEKEIADMLKWLEEQK